MLGVASILLEGESATASTEVVSLLFAVATPVAIIRRVIRESHVDATVVGGALCVYLLIGLFYVQVFTISDRVVDGQFFVQATDPTPADFAYFSYVTMTTVGYGDFTAAGNLDRMFAVTEALIGQLYLVTVVALAVSRVRPGERRRSIAQDAVDVDDDEGGRPMTRRVPDASELGLMVGSPPPEPALVTLANWQDPPFNRWGFQHVRDLIPDRADPARRRRRLAAAPRGARPARRTRPVGAGAGRPRSGGSSRTRTRTASSCSTAAGSSPRSTATG